MANTVTLTTMVDGSRKYAVRVNITGDGSGEETAKLVIDSSILGAPALGASAIDVVDANLNGFSAELLWDATANTQAIALYQGDSHNDFRPAGGLSNPQAAGYTGDILLTTVGLGLGDKGTIIIRGRHKQAN